MNSKRVASLAGAAVLALMVLVPSVAQSAVFYTDPGEVKITAKNLVTAHGAVTFTFAGGALKVGPCSAHADGFVWNEGATPRATWGKYNFGAPCNTNLPGCEATEVTDPETEGEEEWSFSFSGEEERESELEGVETTIDFGAACGAYGLPGGIVVKGSLKGLWTKNACIFHNKSGDLKDQNGNPVAVDGEVCTTDVKNGVPQGKETITYK